VSFFLISVFPFTLLTYLLRSGKTSLLLVLTGLLGLTDGHVLVDNLDLQHVPRETLRNRINVVPQDPVLFASSVRFNLDPMGKNEDVTILQVLESLELTNVVDTMGGLDGVMMGENLSQGQKQIFCLARAILRGGKIVIMDEMTSK
jgi:ABC-type multidrug transport system fused ATPase/permease subunit